MRIPEFPTARSSESVVGYREITHGYNEAVAKQRASNIYHTLTNVFKEADAKGITTNQASGIIAEATYQSRTEHAPATQYDQQSEMGGSIPL